MVFETTGGLTLSARYTPETCVKLERGGKQNKIKFGNYILTYYLHKQPVWQLAMNMRVPSTFQTRPTMDHALISIP
jgi:hypothetical protein